MLVISSHINYSKALNMLLEQITLDRKKIVVVISGSNGHSFNTDSSGLTTITVPTNFYELSAVYGVSKNLDRFPNINEFLFIQDTCVVLEQFSQKYKEFLRTMVKHNADIYYASQDKKCNIVALSRSFLQEHGHVYGKNGTKPEAWAIEHNHKDSFMELAKKSEMKIIEYHEPTEWLPGSVKYTGSDLYRIRVYFKSLDLQKLIASDSDVNPRWEYRNHP